MTDDKRKSQDYARRMVDKFFAKEDLRIRSLKAEAMKPYSGVIIMVVRDKPPIFYHYDCLPAFEPLGYIAGLRPKVLNAVKPPICHKCGGGFDQ